MADFYTGTQLDEKLTDIIWNAKKELIILSPFIRLDDYCKKVVFERLKNRPELKIIIVFGKNEGETQRSLNQNDLDFFKDFDNIVIIYCNNLHAKYYSNENEALLTSLNLLGKSMTGNVEYGVSFSNSKLNIDKLYNDSLQSTYDVVVGNPCVFVKRPLYKKTNFGLSKKYLSSVVLLDETTSLYRNKKFVTKTYHEFERELFDSDVKPSRQEFESKNEPSRINPTYSSNSYNKKVDVVSFNEPTPNNYQRKNEPETGYCIRTGVPIPFNPQKPLSYEAYQTWAYFENWNFPENYCHKTGKPSNGRTSMAKPIL